MTGDGEKVDSVALHVERDLAHRLGGIAMKRNRALTAERGDFTNRLQHADLVIRRHHRHEEGVVAKYGFDVLDRIQEVPLGVSPVSPDPVASTPLETIYFNGITVDE